MESRASPPGRRYCWTLRLRSGQARETLVAPSDVTVLIPRQFFYLLYCRAHNCFRHITSDLNLADLPRQNKVHHSLPRLLIGAQSLQNARGLQLHAWQPAKAKNGVRNAPRCDTIEFARGERDVCGRDNAPC